MKRTELKRTGFLARSRPMRAVNPERRARRRKGYAAHLRSAYFRALRLERFRLDGWRCTEVLEVWPGGLGSWRCPYVDETRTGKGLHAHHWKGYAHFGRETLGDVRTVCATCHRRRHALEGKRIYRP